MGFSAVTFRTRTSPLPSLCSIPLKFILNVYCSLWNSIYCEVSFRLFILSCDWLQLAWTFYLVPSLNLFSPWSWLEFKLILAMWAHIDGFNHFVLTSVCISFQSQGMRLLILSLSSDHLYVNVSPPVCVEYWNNLKDFSSKKLVLTSLRTIIGSYFVHALFSLPGTTWCAQASMWARPGFAARCWGVW